MRRPLVITAALAAAYVVLAAGGTAWGALPVSAENLWGILTGSDDVPTAERVIVLQSRLPQMLLAGLVGAALACSGAALQTSMENPLADPGILGITGGAALGAVLALHTGLAERMFLALPLAALTGAAGTALLVYSLTYLNGRPTVHTLLLTGLAVGNMAFAGVSLIMMITAEYRVLQMLFWLTGGVRSQTWEHIGLAAPGIVLGLVAIFALHRRLDALLLGEEHALAVGVPVVQTRLLVLGIVALTVGSATAATGAISFVGLMVPNILRRLTGSSAMALLPACAAGGALFLTACELTARLGAGKFPLQVGIVTAFLGGPFLLLMLRRSTGERL